MNFYRYRIPCKILSAGVLIAALLLTVFPVPAAAASSAEIQKQIDELEEKNAELQKEINVVRRHYNASYKDMADMVAQKDAIDQEMTLLSGRIENTNQQISAYSQLIADTQEDLEFAESELAILSNAHRERIRAMEEQGDISYWEVIFEANSIIDLLDRFNMVEKINAADRRRMEQMRIASNLVAETRDSLAQEKLALEYTRDQLAADEAALEEKRAESDKLLIELEKKADEYALLLEESEAKQDELMQQIAVKEKERNQAKLKEELIQQALKGQNPRSDAAWKTPVSGYTLTSPFGMRLHPVYKTYRQHNGIDLACPQGTPIYATRAGTVTIASYQAGGAGNYVSINHGDGFASVYMHMTHYVVSVNQQVSQGQLIGYVGSTGVSTGPHLHFGISYAGVYVNPLAYVY